VNSGQAIIQLATKADYARHRGCVKSAVTRAIAEGRIDRAVQPDGTIDVAYADFLWANNTRARGDSGKSAVAAGLGTTAPAPEEPPASPPENGYSAARARREQADADIAVMNARKMRGELVAAEDVGRAGFEIGRDLRDTMEAAVNSLAAEVATLGTAEDCAKALRLHNRTICEVLVRTWREKMGGAIGGPEQ
jgi:hypothetical protein